MSLLGETAAHEGICADGNLTLGHKCFAPCLSFSGLALWLTVGFSRRFGQLHH